MADAYSSQPLLTAHADLITCLSFSASAPSLLASTSLDGWIRIYASSPAAGQHSKSDNAETTVRSHGNGHLNGESDQREEDDWREVGACKANDGPVWKAIWGSREFDTSLLVSIAGSVVHIWETQLQDEGHKLAITQRATLVEARGSLRDIAFAPSEFGVKLATIAADSHLRVYECLDPSSSALSAWSLLEDIDLTQLPNTYFSSASHTSYNATQQTQLIKGFDENNPSGVRRNTGLGPSGGSTASLGTHSAASSSASSRGAGKIESSGAWAVAYCQEAWWGECLAVSSGRDGAIRILLFSPSYWSQLLVLSPPTGSPDSPISTIAWAPSCGRSYHLLAAGSRDGIVRVWKITPAKESSAQWEATLAAEITDHVDGSSGGVGRVEWNVTGTVLSTAGCDGFVRLWKASYSGEWRNLYAISVENGESPSA